MLSIAAMAAGQSSYYTTLAREDYYLDGGEPPGRWHGKGAAALGLTGIVERETLAQLFDGLSPDGQAKLVQLQKGKRHVPGWDLTFSAPKSVSVLWSQVGVELRASLEQAHHRSVIAALDYLESHAAFTRRGRGGSTREPCGLTYALFEHGTSRAQDPQLHTHVLTLNIGSRSDGTFGTIASRDLYIHKMLAGTLYRTQLASECRRLGLELARGKHSFELAAVPPELSEHFSTRRREIVDALAREGLKGPKAAELAALTTRHVKGHVARTALFDRWQEIGREHGFVLPERSAPVNDPPRDTLSRLQMQTGKEVRVLSQRQTHFSEADLLRRVAFAVEHIGLAATDVIQHVGRFVHQAGKVQPVRERHGYARYATAELVTAENELRERAARSRHDRSHILSEKTLQSVCSGRTLRPEQEDALRSITVEAGSIRVIEGMAGTGKTYLLDAAREAWERAGYRVIGCALAARAARQLERDSGIESETLARLLFRLAPPLDARLRQIQAGIFQEAKLSASIAVRNLPPQAEAKARQTFAQHQRSLTDRKLDSRTVVVLDEAGMVDAVQMTKLVREVARSGAKLVLCGDSRQLQPIDAGAPFRTVSRIVGTATLKEVKRQQLPWMREAVHHFADGDARTGLSHYARHGRVFVSATRDTAATRLVSHWNRHRTTDLKESLILAGTRGEVSMLNLMAQELRRLEGELGDRSIVIGGVRYFEGDRVVFTRNNRALGVYNGDFGIIEKIGGLISSSVTPVSIRLDREDQDGRPLRTTLLPLQCPELQLGYAVTTHKSQGATVEKSFILAGGWMQDREHSYVQLSRHRKDARIFASVADAGEDLAELARAMSRSRAKEPAIEPETQKRQREAVL